MKPPLLSTTSHVRKFLDLSTCHLPEHVMNGPLNSFEGVIAYEDEYGAWMWVPNDDTDEDFAAWTTAETPAEVIAIYRYARELDCDYVRFDRDGPQDPALPVWDW